VACTHGRNVRAPAGRGNGAAGRDREVR
jgi:hypothetical protein